MRTIDSLLNEAQKELDTTGILNTPLLTELINSLIKIEYAPGGPYKSNNPKAELLLNSKIEKLFSLLGKPLPNVVEYLKIDNTTSLMLVEVRDHNSNAESNSATNSKAQTYITSLSYEVRQIVQPVFEKITAVDAYGEISKLSYYFAKSFNIKTATPHKLITLGNANILAWIAYTLYDDILDGDAAAQHVPAANILNHESLRLYLKTSKSKGLIFNFFQKTNEANVFEAQRCRFEINDNTVSFKHIPYRRDLLYVLSKRASLHYLGPIILSLQSPALIAHTITIERAFEYYCIARQINDDLHDWVDDFLNGRCTYVVTSLLHKIKIAPGEYDSEMLLQSLKEVFYTSGLETLCDEVVIFIEKSNKIFGQLPNSDHSNLLYQRYFLPIADSAQEAKRKHINNRLALNAYITETFPMY